MGTISRQTEGLQLFSVIKGGGKNKPTLLVKVSRIFLYFKCRHQLYGILFFFINGGTSSGSALLLECSPGKTSARRRSFLGFAFFVFFVSVFLYIVVASFMYLLCFCFCNLCCCVVFTVFFLQPIVQSLHCTPFAEHSHCTVLQMQMMWLWLLTILTQYLMLDFVDANMPMLAMLVALPFSSVMHHTIRELNLMFITGFGAIAPSSVVFQ